MNKSNKAKEMSSYKEEKICEVCEQPFYAIKKARVCSNACAMKKRYKKIKSEAGKIKNADALIESIVNTDIDIALRALLDYNEGGKNFSRDQYESHIVHHIASNGDTMLLLDFAYRITKDEIDIEDPLKLAYDHDEDHYFTMPSTPLMIAAEHNHLWQFTYLLFADANPDARTQGNHTIAEDFKISPDLRFVLELFQNKTSPANNAGPGKILEAIQNRDLNGIVSQVRLGFWDERWGEAVEKIYVKFEHDPFVDSEEDVFLELLKKGERICQHTVIRKLLELCESKI